MGQTSVRRIALMTRLRQANGDDYPAAARKHLKDSAVLLAEGRPDGAAYLSGYVVECTLKTLLQMEQGSAPSVHGLVNLRKQVVGLTAQADLVVGRHCRDAAGLLQQARILVWEPQMRYCAEAVSRKDAAAWLKEASDLYSKVVGALILDGRL